MAGKRRPWRALWAVGGVLPLWLGERTFALPVPSWMVGVAGWSLVALGFLTVALAALWSSRPRERRPSFWPYRPQGLFRVAVGFVVVDYQGKAGAGGKNFSGDSA